MKLTQLKNKNIAIVGLGLTGQSCARYLLRHGIQPVGFDTRAECKLPEALNVADFMCFFGELDPEKLSGFDVILLSPGINPLSDAIQVAKKAGVVISGDIELFVANFSGPVVGVTGSNGKSTVVSMLGDIFTAAGRKVAVGGNIGKPALELLQQDFDVAVLELSSFQLQLVNSLALSAAAFLNLSEDHMDRHASFAAYRAAKLRIFDNARFKVANKHDPNSLPVNSQADALINSESCHLGFGIQENPLAITLNGDVFIYAHEMLVSGLHNLLNAQAAAILAMEMGIESQFVIAALKAYKGLSHRCQKVSSYKDVAWINDSKATNVGATIAAIVGLKPTVKGKLWLVAGGDAKNADLTPLQNYLQTDVHQLITIGKDAPLLASLKQSSVQANTMEEAVNIAARGAKAGDMVLLSPACASLDMYQNFEQRGDVFTRAVEALS